MDFCKFFSWRVEQKPSSWKGMRRVFTLSLNDRSIRIYTLLTGLPIIITKNENLLDVNLGLRFLTFKQPAHDLFAITMRTDFHHSHFH